MRAAALILMFLRRQQLRKFSDLFCSGKVSPHAVVEDVSHKFTTLTNCRRPGHGPAVDCNCSTNINPIAARSFAQPIGVREEKSFISKRR